MKHSLRELAEVIRARVLGDDNVAMTGVSSIGQAAQRIGIVENERNLEAALSCSAAAVIAGRFPRTVLC